MKFMVTHGAHRISETIEVNGKPVLVGRNVNRGEVFSDDQDLAAKYPEKFMRVADEVPALQVNSDTAELDEADVDYSKMTVDQLKKMAEELDINLTGITTKKEIVAAIQVAVAD